MAWCISYMYRVKYLQTAAQELQQQINALAWGLQTSNQSLCHQGLQLIQEPEAMHNWLKQSGQVYSTCVLSKVGIINFFFSPKLVQHWFHVKMIPTSSQPSGTLNSYGIIGLQPTPCPPDLSSGLRYVLQPV